MYDIGYGTVLDSGTTFTYLPAQAFQQFHQHVTDFALARGLHVTPGPDPKYEDSCFGGAPNVNHPDELREVFPTIELHFEVRDVSQLLSCSWSHAHTHAHACSHAELMLTM